MPPSENQVPVLRNVLLVVQSLGSLDGLILSLQQFVISKQKTKILSM